MDTSAGADERIAQLHRRAASLLEAGATEAEALEAMCAEGIEGGYARLLLENVHADRADWVAFRRTLSAGIFFTAAGIVLNLLSFRIAMGGATWIMFWGILVAGIGMVLRAFLYYRKQ